MIIRDLFSLRLFVLACESKSVTKAAERLHLSVSAASRRLQLLEHEARAPLLVRLPHGISPTAVGLTVLHHAREMIWAGERLDASLEEHRSGVRGLIRIWASMSVLEERLASDITGYLKQNPEVRLDLQERTSSATLEALAHKQTDIGVIVRDMPTDGLTTFDYEGDVLAVALPVHHPLAERTTLRLPDLLEEHFISLEPSSAVHRRITEEARKFGRCLKTRIQVTSFGVMCSMIARGLGIGILPSNALSVLARSLPIRMVQLDEAWARRPHIICVRSSGELDSVSQGFIDYLQRPRVCGLLQELATSASVEALA